MVGTSVTTSVALQAAATRGAGALATADAAACSTGFISAGRSCQTAKPPAATATSASDDQHAGSAARLDARRARQRRARLLELRRLRRELGVFSRRRNPTAGVRGSGVARRDAGSLARAPLAGVAGRGEASAIARSDSMPSSLAGAARRRRSRAAPSGGGGVGSSPAIALRSRACSLIAAAGDAEVRDQRVHVGLRRGRARACSARTASSASRSTAPGVAFCRSSSGI